MAAETSTCVVNATEATPRAEGVVRKGIVLAGGSGSLLHPNIQAVNMQILPMCDKRMIFYPLSALMLAGIHKGLIITTPVYLPTFKRLLCDGSSWGMTIQYAIQPSPDGLAQVFLIGAKILGGAYAALILRDNLIHGHDLLAQLAVSNGARVGATVYAYPLRDPERNSVAEFNAEGRVLSLAEKPSLPKSSYASTGLYFDVHTMVERAWQIQPYERGELETSELNQQYLDNGQLRVKLIGRGMAWVGWIPTHTIHCTRPKLYPRPRATPEPEGRVPSGDCLASEPDQQRTAREADAAGQLGYPQQASATSDAPKTKYRKGVARSN